MKNNGSSVLEREVAFMMNIHQDTNDKLNELFEAIGERFEDVATFYKLHIERAIAKYKFNDLNIPESDLIILEQQ